MISYPPKIPTDFYKEVNEYKGKTDDKLPWKSELQSYAFELDSPAMLQN